MTDRHARANAPSRSRSRPRGLDLERVHSARHIDDQSIYHSDLSDTDLAADTDVTDEERLDEEKAREAGENSIPEVRDGVQDEKDLEAGGGSRLEKQTTSGSIKDPNIVTWDGKDDPANPKNWPFKRKWAATFVISSFTFISPVASSMVAPALDVIAKDLHITQSVELQLVLSIFVLAYAIGPLFLGPLSEMYGRVRVLQISNLWFLVFNIACGVSQTKSQMLAFRFLAGLGGSAPLAIGGGVLSDLFPAEQRGKAIAIYSLAPLLGPALGPIAGGFIAETTTWRWAFYATSIATVLIQLSGVIFLQETYAPQLLHVKAKRLRKETGNEALKTEYEHPERTLLNSLRISFVRPFRLLGTQLIVQVMALFMAFQYGLMYLVLSTFSSLFVNKYHESVGISGLNYISLALGCFLGAQGAAPFNDRIYRYYKAKNNNVGKPEFRLLLLICAAPFLPTGLFIYGWTAEFHTHWIWPNIGVVIFAIGIIVSFQCIQTYLIDAYVRYAASAIGAATVMRSLAGFGFPLFAPAMYKTLGYGWGNSVLGFVAIGIGLPAPVLLWFYGERLRVRSPFAAGEKG
jgi:multidrug resistance protein